MYLQWWWRDILIVLEGEGIGTKQLKIAQNVPVYPIVGRKDKKISMMIFGWGQQKKIKKNRLKTGTNLKCLWMKNSNKSEQTFKRYDYQKVV